MRRHAIFFLYFGFLLVFGPLFVSQSLANVYVTNQSDDTVSVIDTTANSVTATIAVGHHPSGIAVTSPFRYSSESCGDPCLCCQ